MSSEASLSKDDVLDNSSDNEIEDDSNEDDSNEDGDVKSFPELPEVDPTHESKSEQPVVVGKPRKIGPQNQKKSIHILLKKSKIYEIRKLTRRIEQLRKMKGTEQQKAKNSRKVEKLLKEIDAMKGFIIETLTERTVDIFKSKAEDTFLEIWAACETEKKVEELLQRYSNDADLQDGDKYDRIAYLKMLSSKDIVGKLRLVSEGVNINAKKNKHRSSRADKKNKKNAQIKGNHVERKTVKENAKNAGTREDESKTQLKVKSEIKNEKEGKTVQNNPVAPKIKDEKSKKISSVAPKINNVKSKKISSVAPKINNVKSKKISSVDTGIKSERTKTEKNKKTKNVADDFFLNHNPNVSDSDDDDDEEFSAPVSSDIVKQDSLEQKKNRMGQRQRKKLLEVKQGIRNKSVGRRTNEFKNRNFGSSKPYAKSTRSTYHSSNRKVLDKQEIDKTLHPSWQAKQKLKKQENIVAFTGTKIVFD